jgi:hypothetical protein
MEEDKNTLLCVVEKTYGEQDLCRAFYFGSTAKFFLKTMFHFFGVWKRKKILYRATRSLPCVLFWAHDKVFFKKTMFHFFRSVEEEKNLCCGPFCCIMDPYF